MPLVLGPLMPSLRLLSFTRCEWCTRSPLHPTATQTISLFAHVTRLELTSCTFQHYGDFQRSFCVLPQPTELVLDGVVSKGGQHSLSSSQATGSELRLTTLHVRSMTSGEMQRLFTWIQATPSVQKQTLYDFCIRPPIRVCSDWHASLGVILRDVGGSLRQARIPVISNGVESCLNFNTELRSLTLFYDHDEAMHVAAPRIANVVNSISAHSIRHFSFWFHCSPDPMWINTNKTEDDIAQMGPLVQGLMARDVFNSLENANIYLFWCTNEAISLSDIARNRKAVDESMIKTSWHRRGILRVLQRTQRKARECWNAIATQLERER